MYLSAIEVDPSPTAPTHHIYCEDFSHKLARGHCERASNDFWGYPLPDFAQTQGGTMREQTNNASKQTSNK